MRHLRDSCAAGWDARMHQGTKWADARSLRPLLRRVRVPVRAAIVAVVAAVLVSCSETTPPPPPPRSAMPPTPYVEKPKEYGPLDALVGSGAGLELALTKMPQQPGDFLEGYYYWTPQGDVEVDPRVRGPRTDVALKCDRVASSPKNHPSCGTPTGKRIKLGARIFCFDPQEKSGPAGLPAHYGAYIAWSGLGDCSLQFNLGLVPDERRKKAALAAAAAAADWMDGFLPDAQKPPAPMLAMNRAIIDTAERAGKRRWR